MGISQIRLFYDEILIVFALFQVTFDHGEYGRTNSKLMSKLIFCWKLPPKKFTLWPVYVTPCKIHFKLDDVLDNLHQRLGKRNFPIASSAWIEKVPRQVSTNWTSVKRRGPTNQLKQQPALLLLLPCRRECHLAEMRKVLEKQVSSIQSSALISGPEFTQEWTPPPQHYHLMEEI